MTFRFLRFNRQHIRLKNTVLNSLKNTHLDKFMIKIFSEQTLKRKVKMERSVAENNIF